MCVRLPFSAVSGAQEEQCARELVARRVPVTVYKISFVANVELRDYCLRPITNPAVRGFHFHKISVQQLTSSGTS